MKILFAEDDRDLCRAMEALLKHAGYTVDVVNNGRDALAPRGDGRRATLTVENGLSEPLEPEALKHLFDRFYRADSSRSKESGGYGIGLSVARAVAEKHGGDIRAKQTGEGRLRFTVSLPLKGASKGA